MITQQQIKYIRSLHQKKFRDHYNCFIAEGEKIVNEAIVAQPNEIELIVCTPDSIAFIKKGSHTNKIINAGSKEFSRISGQKTPQGVLAVLRKKKPTRSISDIDGSVVLALDRIQDPGNFGTILRLADWFGVRNVLCSNDCVDVYNPKVIQASMGAFLRIDLQYGLLNELLKRLKEKKGYSLVGTTLDGHNMYKEKFDDKTVFILGNESSGISESILSNTDRQIRIPNCNPSREKTESLNVSVAAAIICAEFRRREKISFEMDK